MGLKSSRCSPSCTGGNATGRSAVGAPERGRRGRGRTGIAAAAQRRAHRGSGPADRPARAAPTSLTKKSRIWPPRPRNGAVPLSTLTRTDQRALPSDFQSRRTAMAARPARHCRAAQGRHLPRRHRRRSGRLGLQPSRCPAARRRRSTPAAVRHLRRQPDGPRHRAGRRRPLSRSAAARGGRAALGARRSRDIRHRRRPRPQPLLPPQYRAGSVGRAGQSDVRRVSADDRRVPRDAELAADPPH